MPFDFFTNRTVGGIEALPIQGVQDILIARPAGERIPNYAGVIDHKYFHIKGPPEFVQVIQRVMNEIKTEAPTRYEEVLRYLPKAEFTEDLPKNVGANSSGLFGPSFKDYTWLRKAFLHETGHCIAISERGDHSEASANDYTAMVLKELDSIAPRPVVKRPDSQFAIDWSKPNDVFKTQVPVTQSTAVTVAPRDSWYNQNNKQEYESYASQIGWLASKNLPLQVETYKKACVDIQQKDKGDRAAGYMQTAYGFGNGWALLDTALQPDGTVYSYFPSLSKTDSWYRWEASPGFPPIVIELLHMLETRGIPADHAWHRLQSYRHSRDEGMDIVNMYYASYGRWLVLLHQTGRAPY